MIEANWYPLAVAGVRITLKTAIPLTVPERFRPFIIDLDKAGYLVEFRENSGLSAPEGALLYRGERYEVYPAREGGFVRWYFDEMQDFTYFARVTADWVNRQVLVEYVPSGKTYVSEMGNCFSFGGWETLLLREHRLLLHAACVDTSVGGLLFSGPSGIGKSTQAGLWQKYVGARLINGDRPILHQTETGWEAWGSPYAGSSRWFVNESCRVRAIVMLRQADRCSLRKLSGAEAFRNVFSGVTAAGWDPSCMLSACELTERLISEIPVYEFSCTPDETAVELLKAELERKPEYE